MKRKLFIILFVFILVIACGIIYLNKVLLPVKIKSLVIQALEKETQKEVSLDSVKFNIFKGLVIKNLVLSDATGEILTLKEASCTFLIPPVFKRKIIIPYVRLDSARVFLERRSDNTFNLGDLFPEKTGQATKKEPDILIYKINITNSRIDFRDSTFAVPFNKSIDNLNLSLFLSLPVSVKFNLRSEIQANPGIIKIKSSGEFKIPDKELNAKVAFTGISPKEFLPYCQKYGVSISAGLIDAKIDLNFKNGIISFGLIAQGESLEFSKDKITVKLNSEIKADARYSLKDKQLHYSGDADIFKSDISGIEFVKRIDEIKGKLKFSDTGISCDNLNASVFGVPLEAKINLADFNNPLLDANIASSLSLDSIQGILKDKFQLVLPAIIQGKVNLSLNLQSRLAVSAQPKIYGYLDVIEARVKLQKPDYPFENINGRIEFNQNQLKWSGLAFKYNDTDYKTGGELTNFQAPGIQAEFSSKDLSLKSSFAIDGGIINVTQLSGKYFNSDFLARGNVDIREPSNPRAQVNADLDINLKDIKEILPKIKERLGQIKPEGLVHVNLDMDGNLGDIKSCMVQAELSSESLSAYGLKSEDFLLKYGQQDGIAAIPLMHLSMYQGSLDLSGGMNLKSQNIPYWIDANVKNVKIEELKLDTPARQKDIAGTIQAQVKINGFSNDLSKIKGGGSILITEGKLWELNLFKGLGELLFAKDFAYIVFNEGSCGFFIQDKYIATDNLKLKSNLANLAGAVKIGFDGSLDGSFNVEVLDEKAPQTGTLKDITTAIIGQAARFGVITLSGTLKEPKYRFKPAVVDILKGLKDSIFGRPAE